MSDVSPLDRHLQRLERSVRRLRAGAERYKLPLTLLAAAIFFVGLFFSIHSLGLTFDQISLGPLLLVLLLFAPLGLMLAAWNLQITSHLTGHHVDFRLAIAATAYGRIAEILPLPGTAIARGAALMEAGAGIKDSTLVLGWTSLLTLAMAVLFAAVPIGLTTPVAGIALGLVSLLGCGVSLYWIARRCAAATLAATIGVRFANLLLGIARMFACFAAIGVPVSLVKSAVFMICATLTSLIGIVPAGLGISELMGAGLAMAVAVSPTAAFLAVALNRLTGLLMSGLIAFFLYLLNHRKRMAST